MARAYPSAAYRIMGAERHGRVVRAFDAWPREGNGCTATARPTTRDGGLEDVDLDPSLVSSDGLTHPGETGAGRALVASRRALALVLAFDCSPSRSPPSPRAAACRRPRAQHRGSSWAALSAPTASVNDERPRRGAGSRCGWGAAPRLLPLVDLESGWGPPYLPALRPRGMLVVGRGASFGSSGPGAGVACPSPRPRWGAASWREIVRRIRVHPITASTPSASSTPTALGRFADPRWWDWRSAPGGSTYPPRRRTGALPHPGVARRAAVIVRFGASTEKEMVTVPSPASLDGVEVFIVPRFFDVGARRVLAVVRQHLGQCRCGACATWASPLRWRFKGALDVVVAGWAAARGAAHARDRGPISSAPGPGLFASTVAVRRGVHDPSSSAACQAKHVPTRGTRRSARTRSRWGGSCGGSSLDELPSCGTC